MFPPERIVCLTEETVETLYLLGEDRRIVGISGYVVRPPRARREKPRVSAFTSADIPKILALKPDLVLTFSDLQADIAARSSGTAWTYTPLISALSRKFSTWFARSVRWSGHLIAPIGWPTNWRRSLPARVFSRRNCESGRRSISRNGTIR